MEVTEKMQKAFNAIASAKMDSRTKLKVKNLLLDIELHGVEQKQLDYLANVLHQYRNNVINFDIHILSLQPIQEAIAEPKGMSTILFKICSVIDDPLRNLLAEEIIAEANNYFKFDIRIKSRRRKYVSARHFTIKIMREQKISLHKIGREMGGKDHSTIIHSLNKLKDDLEYSPELRKEFETFRSIFINSPS